MHSRRSTRTTNPIVPAALAAIVSLALVAGLDAQEASLKWKSSNVTSSLSGFSPQRLTLSNDKPAALKKAPKDLKSPHYGEIKIGPKESPAALLVLLDEPEGQTPRLFIDSNNNGDLTDDAPAKWEERTTPGPGGKETMMYNGDATVKIPYPGGAKEAHLVFYRFGKGDERGVSFKNFIFYYRDYALSGEVKLGDKSYPAMLVDENATGDFRGAESKSSGVRFLVDVDSDGKFNPRCESYDLRAPFNIGGTTYEISDMKADGRFKIAKSSKTVEETKPAPNLAKGAKAPSFTAKATSGRQVKFPEDYKGKIVLVDFWAIWCGPCVREIPNVVANYEKYHDKGFEILGISFDRENSADKVSSFTAEKRMPWLQIYEGKFWSTDIGKLYDIHSIPSMLIVDGDTGEILAGTEARGPNLEPAIKSALEKKKESSKTAK